MHIPKDTTSLIVQVFIQDTTSLVGAGKTGLAHNTAGLSAYYARNIDSGETAITLADMTLGTWASGGFKEVDATNMPGVYQVGVPNAALASASGLRDCVVQIKGTSLIAAPLRLVFIDNVYQDRAWMTKDGSTQRYGIQWYKNGEPALAGVTDAEVRVFANDASGTELLAATAMEEVGSEHVFFLDETVDLQAAGDSYTIEYTATIDGATRTVRHIMSRDSS